MKCLLCEDCGDIIAPLPLKREPRLCNCERHAVWWEDPKQGVIRVCDMKEKAQRGGDFTGAPLGAPRCWLLGITNLFLRFRLEGRREMSSDDIVRIIDAHDDSYLFKQQRSAVIRFRPGETGDSAWADVPDFADRGARIH